LFIHGTFSPFNECSVFFYLFLLTIILEISVLISQQNF
jgi:hypothetical protein